MLQSGHNIFLHMGQSSRLLLTTSMSIGDIVMPRFVIDDGMHGPNFGGRLRLCRSGSALHTFVLCNRGPRHAPPIVRVADGVV